MITVTPIFINGGNCSGQPKTFSITVLPSPKLSSTLNPLPVCSNMVFSYTPASATAGTIFFWSRPAIPGITPSVPASGTGNPNELLINTTGSPVLVTYVYTLTANGCTNVQNVTVTVNPKPVLTSTLTPPAICSNTVFSYIPASSTPGTTIFWTRSSVAGISPAGPTAGNGNPNETLVNNTTVPQAVTYIYTVNANGCTNVQNVTVMVNPVADVTTANSVAICSGVATNIVLSSNVAGATYNWTIGPMTGNITGATAGGGSTINQILNNTGVTAGSVTYIVTPMANSCSGTTTNITVTVNPKPGMLSVSTDTICTGTATSILLNSDVAGATFSWTVGPVSGGVTGATASSGTTISQTLVNPGTTPGTVTYIVTPLANACPGNPMNITVTVDPATGATTFTTGATAVCQDAPDETYTASALNSTSVAYSVTPATAGIIDQVSGTMNWDAAYTGTATITAISTGLCGVTTAHRVVSVNSAPVLVITNPAPVCYPGTADITASSVTSGSAPGLTYSYWTDAGATIVYPTPVSATAGTYYIKATAAPGCLDIKPVEVTVQPKPLASAGGSRTICATESVTVSGASYSNGIALWKTSGNGVLSGASTMTPTYTSVAADAGTTVTLTLTVTSNNACFPQKDSARYTIYVKQSQTIPFPAMPEKTYGDNTFTLSATASSGLGITYTSSANSVASVSGNYVTIKGAGNAIIYANQPGNTSVCPAPEVSQVLKVKPMDISVTVNPLQSKIYGSADPVLSYTCYPPLVNGDKFTGSLTRTAGENPGTYNIQQGTLSAGSNYSIVSFIPSYFIINKAELNVSAGTAERHYLEPNPTFTIVYSGFVNGEEKSVLDILPTATTIANSESDAGSYSITVSGGSDNNYSFRYLNGVLEIQKADQYIIFNDIPDKLRKTQQCQLEAIASSGLPVSFKSDDLKKGIIEGSTLIVLKEGQNEIIASQDGNQNWNPAPLVTKSYVGQPTFDNVTSMYTPNGDGVNDYWYIPDIETYGTIQVKVYNRFGKLVYESQYYKNNWDGTFNSAPLPSASYYYVIKSSEKGIINGVVNIVR
jgi:gliding motility-associated-like protein